MSGTVVRTSPENTNLGEISGKYESGNLGYEAISSGKDDPGGVSYGKYQLASKTGTLQSFLKTMGYAYDFKGLTPGTDEFNKEWIALCASPFFTNAQDEFIKNTHYDPVRLVADGLNIKSTKAINEVLWSMSVQHGRANKIIRAANINADDSETEQINKLYLARIKYVKGLTLKTNVISSLINRYALEKKDVLKLI